MKTLINKIEKYMHISKSVLAEIILTVILFGSPLLILYLNSSDIGHDMEIIFLCWSICIIFVLNFRLLVPNYLLYPNKKIFKFILLNILLVTLLSVSMFFIDTAAREHDIMHKQVAGSEIIYDFPPSLAHIENHNQLPPHAHKKPPINIMFLISKVLPMIFAVGASIGIRTITEVREQNKKINELKHSYSEAELKNLRKQFSPHFLFNTLNNIYALIDTSPEMSKEAIIRLSNMMRKVMLEYKTFHCVSLKESIAFLQDYIELMKLRTNDNLDLKISLPTKTESFWVPPLLFIVLVENAFKHGVSPSKKSFVYINIAVEDGKTIVCEVENSYFENKIHQRKKSGEGIDDLRKRLDIIYPSEYTLTMNHDDKKYIAKLVIPIKREERYIC